MKMTYFGVPLAMLIAGATLADDAKTEQGLVGTWKITSFLDDGGERLGRLGQAKQGSPPKLIIAKDACWVIGTNGKQITIGGLMNCAWKSYQLDAKEPSHILLTGTTGKGNETLAYLGIWKIEGDKLFICWNEGGLTAKGTSSRPATFESNGSMNLFVCERLSDKPEEKPKDAAPKK